MKNRLLIRSQSVTKEYLVNRSAYGQGIKDLFSSRNPHEGLEVQKVQALENVTFDLYEGESLGIIGRNGAGKSTLLKILSGITAPSSGRVELYGRTISILDIGTGFHPDLSGRENIFMSGSILGMSKKEVSRKFDEIVAFSGVSQYIEMPVKRYSSGMYLRLAFSVIAHLEAEIMLFDEVMSVGDAQFRMKSMEKIHELAQSGRTLILVSHNMTDVMTICNRCMMLEQGRVKATGEPFEIISTYMDGAVKDYYDESISDGPGAQLNSQSLEDLQDEAEENGRQLPHQRAWEVKEAPGSADLKVRAVSYFPKGKAPGTPITREDAVCIQWQYEKPDPKLKLDWTVIVYDQLELPLLTASTVYPSFPVVGSEPDQNGLFTISCTLPAHFFNRGIFLFSLFALYGEGNKLEVFRPLAFQVVRPESEPSSFFKEEQFKGPVRPEVKWEQ